MNFYNTGSTTYTVHTHKLYILFFAFQLALKITTNTVVYVVI